MLLVAQLSYLFKKHTGNKTVIVLDFITEEAKSSVEMVTHVEASTFTIRVHRGLLFTQLVREVLTAHKVDIESMSLLPIKLDPHIPDLDQYRFEVLSSPPRIG